MLANLEGYNKVEYTKGGNSGSFMNVYVSTDRAVDYGAEYYAVTCSTKYWNEKIYPAFRGENEVHIGFDKEHGGKPFLYVKK